MGVGTGVGRCVGVAVGGTAVGVGVIVGDGVESHATSKAAAIRDTSPMARIPRGTLHKRGLAPETVISITPTLPPYTGV